MNALEEKCQNANPVPPHNFTWGKIFSLSDKLGCNAITKFLGITLMEDLSDF